MKASSRSRWRTARTIRLCRFVGSRSLEEIRFASQNPYVALCHRLGREPDGTEYDFAWRHEVKERPPRILARCEEKTWAFLQV